LLPIVKNVWDEPVFVTVPLHEVKGAIPVARNNVFAAPKFNSFIRRNTKTQPSTMDDNIFTDMLEKR